MTTLQDILGLITKRKIKTPSDNDYIISAAYSDRQEVLKPQPKMEASLLNIGALKKYVLASIAPPTYKVYTALLTQNGSGDTQNLSSGAVTKGVTYQISGVGFDCTNVGAPNNDNGTYFVATNNEVPTTYGAGSLEYNTGAPVVTVLENTIGNIWFTYSSTGTYFINSDTLFTDDKTTFSINLMGGDIGTGYFCLGEFNGDSSLGITTGSPEYGEIDDVLSNTTPIEIRVYN